MPGMNGVGPMWCGPGTGWGRGPCRGGGRWGAGGGRFGAGFGGGRRRMAGAGWPERQALEAEEAALSGELGAVRRRLETLREAPDEPAR